MSDKMRRLAESAGVLPHEMMDDPEHGLLISPAGVQKIKALSSDGYAAAAIGQRATKASRSGMRLVGGKSDD